MPALHASAAARATADVHVKASDHGPHDREIFLILRRDACALQRPATIGTRVRQRSGVPFIDAARPRSTGAAARCRTRPPSGTAATSLRAILRKRRGLAKAGAACRIELLFETVVRTLQPIAFALGLTALLFRARQLVAQSRDLVPLPLDQIVTIVTGGTLVRHAGFMPCPRNLYKYDFLDLP
jgi:hypothetical protein